MPDSKVVDAWALLAWLRNEQPAAGRVRDCLQQAEDGEARLFMSWVNAGEVYYMIARKHDPKAAEDFLTRLPSLPILLVVPDKEDIMAAARLKSVYRLSYADAFATALALKEHAAVITGDPEIRDMAANTTGALLVEWIGP
jgi:uncharacterized protein